MKNVHMPDKLGICQWFHYEDTESVARAVELLNELGIRHLRTGLSWADFHRPRGPEWYHWMFRQLEEFEILLSVWHTPPSIAEGGVCNGPPLRLLDYGEFIWQVGDEYGEFITHLELWNEPNNRYKWDFQRFDPRWEKFGRMVAPAAQQGRRDGKTTVLGGMIPVDHHWLELMKAHGALEEMDVVAIHAFPEMWWPGRPNWDWFHRWDGWAAKIDYLAQHTGGRPVWVTETGLATWNLEHQREDRFALQVEMLHRAAQAPVDRLYWYSLIDLDPERDAIEGFHVDENEYHMGLVSWRGDKKEAFDLMKDLLASPDPPARMTQAATAD